ncbi:MAG: ABC transporter ATP-binding protein [Chloroflexota bacterium]
MKKKNLPSQPLLEGKNVSKNYGGLVALDNVDFAVHPGEIIGLIGPNGSGKTTLFDCLSRVQNISSGNVFFKGKEVSKLKSYQVAHMGMARTFQVFRVYRKLSVFENMLLSRQWRGEHIFRQLRPSDPENEARARELLSFLTIDHLIHENAGNLSGGQQRLLEIGMALMPDPDIILLDEAASGVNPVLIETITERIKILSEEQGKTFLLIEHNMRFIADLCSRVFVLNLGEKLAEGTPAQVMENDHVIEAYFGA